VTKSILDSGIKLVKNVSRYNIGQSSLKELTPLLRRLRKESSDRGKAGSVVFLVDHFFKNSSEVASRLNVQPADFIDYVDTTDEPMTKVIDELVAQLIQFGFTRPAAIVGMGGSITMDEIQRSSEKP